MAVALFVSLVWKVNCTSLRDKSSGALVDYACLLNKLNLLIVNKRSTKLGQSQVRKRRWARAKRIGVPVAATGEKETGPDPQAESGSRRSVSC